MCYAIAYILQFVVKKLYTFRVGTIQNSREEITHTYYELTLFPWSCFKVLFVEKPFNIELEQFKKTKPF